MVCACDLKYMLLPGSWKVTYSWVCKRWWGTTCFFFSKHWNTIPKLWSLTIIHPSSSWVDSLLHMPTAVVWLCSSMETVLIRCLHVILCIYSVLLFWIQRTLACKAVSEERFLCQQTAGQSLGLWPWPSIQCKQNPMRFSNSCCVILLHLSYRTD